jgi:hypothetical protein
VNSGAASRRARLSTGFVLTQTTFNDNPRIGQRVFRVRQVVDLRDVRGQAGGRPTDGRRNLFMVCETPQSIERVARGSQ